MDNQYKKFLFMIMVADDFIIKLKQKKKIVNLKVQRAKLYRNPHIKKKRN